VKAPESRAQDDRDARQAERERHDAAAVHALAEEQHGEQRHPHRHGELDGEYGGEGQRGDGVHPAELPAEVHERAREVRRQAARAQRRGAGARDDSHHHGEGDQRAQEQDLEHADGLHQLAHRDRHQRERQHRAAHPQHGAQRVLI
jgi:hypothetical protein